MVKLHLGCGDVYLKGYINIDIEGTIGKGESVNIQDYYKDRQIGKPGETIVDVKEDIFNLKYKNVSEILLVQVFEHFSKEKSIELLRIFKRMLRKGGKLVIDVPDMEETFKIKDINWKMRLIYGTQKDGRFYHKWGYTPKSLKRLMKQVGFEKIIRKDLFPSDKYPRFTIIAIK